MWAGFVVSGQKNAVQTIWCVKPGPNSRHLERFLFSLVRISLCGQSKAGLMENRSLCVPGHHSFLAEAEGINCV